MLKTRTLFFIVMAVIVGVLFLILRDSKELYKAVPVDASTPLTAKAFEDWHLYQPPNKAFTVSFPGLPQHAADTTMDPATGQNRKYEMYVAQKGNGNLFMITMITFPQEADVSRPELLLATLIEDMQKADSKNELKEKKEDTYLGQPSVVFSIENEKLHTTGRAFIKGKTLYFISYIAPIVQYQNKEFEHFVNSFKLEK